MPEPIPHVPSLEQSLGYALPADCDDGHARAIALSTEPLESRLATSLVSYQSQGNLLIVGDQQQALSQAAHLAQSLRCTVLIQSHWDAGAAHPGAAVGSEHLEPEPNVEVFHARIVELSGHLGRFVVRVTVGDKVVNLAHTLDSQREHFDLVLDLGQPPQLDTEVPPLGYYAPGEDTDELRRALAELPELVGEFEKPKYFNLNTDICAHSASGLVGCTRCLETCPTGAIRSLSGMIDVDPYLCQGGGSCATACPTGAMTFAYPVPSELIARAKIVLRRYREAGGSAPQLLFHDGETGQDWVAQAAPALPPRVIPIAVEEAGSVGADTWLTAIAYGAAGVVILCPPTVPVNVRAELGNQVEYARALLEGMGYPGDCIRLCAVNTPGEIADWLSAAPDFPQFEPATFATFDEKRTTIRMAVDHLYAHAPTPHPVVELPTGAPFGEIRVDTEACTLCMACVSVCPAGALADGGDEPKLGFVEWNCVQCGLCETACPENAISLQPRMAFDPEMRGRTRTLNHEQPFHCVVCGKPFATQSVMQRMEEKLKGHWMFEKPEAMRRLRMCEDCRVKDMFSSEGGMMQTHRKPAPPS